MTDLRRSLPTAAALLAALLTALPARAQVTGRVREDTTGRADTTRANLRGDSLSGRGQRANPPAARSS